MKSQLQKINEFINNLGREEYSILEKISTTKTYKKGEVLLHQNETCRFTYSVEKGILRKFYLNDGKEITTEFLFEDDIAVSFDSYVLQKPSREFIQAITDSTVSQLDYHSFQEAKSLHSELVKLDLLITEYYAMWLENRLLEFHTLNATQRYLHLLSNQPEIIQQIPLSYIASYLGISLETLSRIRAKI
ncbi:CRP-like cAMP-binding protein [Mesonia hippocampi]|uniref:CRP-like cAMP-binding protein n=2 Tax=Mesonia hippocampi TaxID=1628250 RepID=A0A840EPJ2_9FLAO|nr:CRP-like cAMP-binding protein [Mesonia hippocampi]